MLEWIMQNMGFLLIFLVKVLDNVIQTGKTILIQKNKSFIAAVTTVVSQVIFYKLISTIISSDSDLQMWLVSIASGVGTYMTLKLNDKFSKDVLFVNNIMSDDKEAMIELCEYLRANKIRNLVVDSYTKDWGKTLSVTVFAETKHESKLVSKFLRESDKKYVRIVK